MRATRTHRASVRAVETDRGNNVAANPWVWDTTSRRYRNVDTGRWLSHKTITTMRNDLAAAQRDWADTAASALVRGDWTVRRWELEIRERLKTIYLSEYMLGRGGKNAMTQADYGRVGNLLKTQYDFLRGFALDIQDGQLSEAQIAARTQMYHESSIQAFERGKAVAYDAELILPAYPGDGRTPCRARCKCRWSIRETKTAWKATWLRSKAESCTGCITRSQIYNPFVQSKLA
jgi:hypothetical protein